ncbi:MAG: protein TolQ [Hydrogenophilus sp.]|nr:protein TolQ [Hydrogenophilus sp.]
MGVTSNLSVWHLVVQASVPVQVVMALLLGVSLISWFWIFRKAFQIRAARTSTLDFEQRFWRASSLEQLAQGIEAHLAAAGPMELVFLAAYRELIRQQRSGLREIESVRRAMQAAYQREMDELEAHLAFLASVGSVAPYIGLFGTVWGIMNSFRGLASMSSATLATVAPGIAEALIATAIGLFAAIPAVVAYNRFTHDIERLAVRLESFIEELTNLLQRQLLH